MQRAIIQRSLCGAAALAALIGLGLAAPASAQIESPGRHPIYGFELEPHLVWQWTGDEAARGDGVGLGFRIAIPLLDNGPVPTINNNLAIAFGLDWAHFSDSCGPGDCDEDDIWLPVTLQWNFFLTSMISIFPELGLGFRNAILDYDDYCRDGLRCRGSGSDLSVHLVLWFGARFKLSDNVALILRLGVPMLHFGASFSF
jgi:hypothetical protein